MDWSHHPAQQRTHCPRVPHPVRTKRPGKPAYTLRWVGNSRENRSTWKVKNPTPWPGQTPPRDGHEWPNGGSKRGQVPLCEAPCGPLNVSEYTAAGRELRFCTMALRGRRSPTSADGLGGPSYKTDVGEIALSGSANADGLGGPSYKTAECGRVR